MRRTIILFFVALILVAIAAFFAFIFSPSSQENGDQSGNRGGGLGSLFPFNFGGNNNQNQGGGSGREPEGQDNRPVPELREVSNKPTSGGFLYTNADGVVMIRYIDRATGHVFETSTESLGSVRISNTTIPGIQEVLFSDQNNFIIRYLTENDEIENFYGRLTEEREEQTLRGDFVRSWERGVFDTSGENLLVVDEDPSGSTLLLSNPDGTNERQVFISSLRSWIPLQSDGGLYVQSAPSPNIPGSLFRISNGELTKVVGGIEGMVAIVSPSGRYVLTSGGLGSQLVLHDTEQNETYSAVFSSVATKCVFVSEAPVQIVCGVPFEMGSGEYPNDWFIGRAQFDDDIWLLEPVEGVASLLAVPSEDVGRIIDVSNIAVDASGSYVSFINKTDLSFWTLKIANQEEQEQIEE